MNEQTPQPVPSRVRKTNSMAKAVWLVPALALLTGGWLLMNNIRNSGPEITLYLNSAEGIEVNNTVIRVLDVEVGRVSKIRLREDLKGVELTAKLNADASEMMREDTQFWIVKPRIDQSGISGLNTLVSGSYIAFLPGKSEQEQDEFTVAEQAPLNALSQSGLRLRLSGDNNKMLEVGSPVMFEGFQVGVVENAKFDPQTRRVNYSVLIKHPNDKLISLNSRFWLQSGISVQANNGGVKVDGLAFPALLSGAIAFTTPPSADGTNKAVANNDEFELYNDRSSVENLPDERALYYVVFFKQSIRGLSAGSPVEYKGVRIGSVSDAPFFAPNDSLNLLKTGYVPVRIRIDPQLMEINAPAQNKAFWQNTVQTALNRGLSAILSSDNLVLGSKMIELSDAPSAEAAVKPYSHYDQFTVIASRGGGLDDLQAQVNKLLKKINDLPLNQTVTELNAGLGELKATLKSVNQLVSKPQTQQIPAEVNKALSELRQTLNGVQPNSPVYQDAQNTLNSLNKTLRDVQPLIQTLKEKPNALIFNNSSSDPTPKGNR